jgi:hypothetical protein
LSLRTDVLRLSAAALLGFVFAMRRSEARLVRQLRDRFTFYRLNPLDRWVLRRLVRNGVATLVDEGRYAFIPDGYASFRTRRRVRGLVLLAMLALALVILWRLGALA